MPGSLSCLGKGTVRLASPFASRRRGSGCRWIEVGSARRHDQVQRDDLVPDSAVPGALAMEALYRQVLPFHCVELMRYGARTEERGTKILKEGGEQYALTQY